MIVGQGLHGGEPARIRFERHDGPLEIVQGEAVATLADLEVVDVTRATTVAAKGLRVRSVEHVFGALAGLGLHEGVRLVIEGAEVPLFDGCAAAFADALSKLDVAPTRPSLVVTRRAEITVGESRYVFEPHAGVALEVTIDFEDARIAKDARWDGDPRDFLARIAPARMFGFAHEIDALAAKGLVSHVAPESVVVFTPAAVLFSGRAFAADEPARHKLLDLAGDLFIHGGPPIGRVIAHRPGHGATHAALVQAQSMGVVSSRP